MRYIRNLRSNEAKKLSNPEKKAKNAQAKPKFDSKAEFRDWCANANTDHLFISYCEGDAPSQRISNSNPVNKCSGFIADYDAPLDWSSIEAIANAAFTIAPTWVSKTFSGYARFIWKFEDNPFIKEVARVIKAPKAIAGFDEASYKPNQYFEIGSDWILTGGEVSSDTVRAALMKAASNRPPESTDTTIPMGEIAKEVGLRGRFSRTFVLDQRRRRSRGVSDLR
jgi:hypothetical protein